MKKKDYNGYLIMDFIIIGLKLLAGLLGHSLALLSTILFDVAVLITSFLALKGKETTTRGKMIGTIFYSFILCLLSILNIFIVYKTKIWNPSLLILIFWKSLFVMSLVIVFVFPTNVVKMTESCKVKNAASEDFALFETIFALFESLHAPKSRLLTHFLPQFTHFKPPDRFR